MLAMPRPTRSTFSLKLSLYFMAYAREVAALWARMTMKIERAVGSIALMSSTVTPWGTLRDGRPPGMLPRVPMPRDARSKNQLRKIMPRTAMRAPGIFRLTLRRPTMMTMTATAMSRSPQTADPRSFTTLARYSTGPEPVLGNPNIDGTCPMATWIPTPVRNPTRTLADRKLAMKPRRSNRARMRNPAGQQGHRGGECHPLG